MKTKSHPNHKLNCELLGSDFKPFLHSLVKRRTYLLETCKSKRNQDHMCNLVSKFTPYLPYNWSDFGAARFVKKHYAELCILIPSNAKATYRQLDGFRQIANQIINTKIPLT